LGNWNFTDDVHAVYKSYADGVASDEEFNAYVKDLKVGDQPQTSMSFTATVFPVRGLSVAITGFYYADHYAKWEPFNRTLIAEAGIQPWKIPSYSVIDLHANYTLPIKVEGIGFEIFGHIFNLLDEEYISDATDNSGFNAYGTKAHKADDAEVYFGLPQYFNAGIRLTY
jgi:outer membrane receptor protein involved in Fe transport